VSKHSLEQSGPFLSLLRTALHEPHSRLVIVATLRSDFLAAFQRHPQLQGVEFESLSIGPMPAERFDEIIRGPARIAGITLDEGLAHKLAADTKIPDALPLLAVVLHKLWEYGEAEAVMRPMRSQASPSVTTAAGC